MWDFYRDVSHRMVAAMNSAAFRVEAAIGVGLWLVGLFHQQIVQSFSSLSGVSRGYAWIPLVAVFAHLFFRAVYDRFRAYDRYAVTNLDLVAMALHFLNKHLVTRRVE